MPEEIKNLRELYATELEPKLIELDGERRLIIKLIKRYVLISIFPLFVISFISYTYQTPIPILITLAICVGISIYKINPIWSNYYTRFKQGVIKEIIGFISKDLEYDHKDYLNQSIFENCGIHRTHIDRYNGDDMVWGRIGVTDIQFSEVHAEYKTTTTNSKGHRQTHWHTIFKGLMFSADFNKNFNVKTYVLTDTAEKLFGSFGTKFQKMSSHGELVKLEDPEFEKSFVVYSGDQTEARYILSTSLMRRILDYKVNCKKNIQLSFVSNRMYVAIPYSKGLFEPKLFGDIVNFSNIEEYYNDLKLVLNLVEDLNLNTRIWLKK